MKGLVRQIERHAYSRELFTDVPLAFAIRRGPFIQEKTGGSWRRLSTRHERT